LDYMFLGSVARKVVRDSPCPVYTIREQENPRAPQKIDCLLSPIDFSEHSGLAVSLARETAGLYDAKLQILHVIEKASYPSFYKKENIEDTYPGANMAGLVHAEMNRFYRESEGPDVEVEFHAVEGHVAHEILEYAERNDINMIVIATHGLSGLKHLLLGSVAEKVINRSPCPVLTVKGFGKNLIKS
ncbi:MAG: universal stress protein, partial [Acidobacteriota bacterium]